MQVAAAAPSLSRRTRKLTGACVSSLVLLSAFLFVARDAAAAQSAVASASQTSRRKVITNKDLEGVRRKRLAEEAEYERKRAAEGLPSQEELRKQAEERDRRFIELAARLEAARAAEEYENMRRELSLLRSQLNFIGAQSAIASSVETAAPLYYSFPVFVPGGRLSPFFRHGTRGRAAHGRSHFPPGLNPFRHGLPNGFHGRRPTGGLSLQLRFGSTPRAVRPPGRVGHGRGSSGRR